MRSCLLVVNPKSGSGRAIRRARELTSGLGEGCRFEVLETQRRGHAADDLPVRAASFESVVAVGGDGTLNEVLSGLMRIEPMERRSALGFLPAGTANVAVLAFGFGTEPGAVARSLEAATPRPVDVGIASHEGAERPFLLWCGAGYDAVVIDALNRERTGLMGLAGLVRKAPGVLRAVHRYPAPAIDVETDGVTSRGASVILANVGKVAFGGSVADGADPFDGRLDVVSVPRLGTLGMAALGVRMLMSSLERAPGVGHGRGTHIRLQAREPVPFQLDGEPVGQLPVDVRIVPGAVRLLLT